MKTRTQLSVLVALLCASSVSIRAAVVYSTGFEGGVYTPGALNGQDGWVLFQSGGGSVNVQSAVVHGGSQAARIIRGGGNAPHGVLRGSNFNAAGKILSVEGYVHLQTAASPSRWTVIQTRLVDGFFFTNIDVNIQPSGEITVNDGAASHSTAVFAARGQWHRVEQVFDFNTRMLRVYFNGVKVYMGTFAGTANTVSLISFYGSGFANDSAYFDDYTLRTLGSVQTGIYNSGIWRLDSNDNAMPDDPFFVFDAGPSATRITGDWNGDGRDNIGLYISGFWYLDFNGNGAWDGNVVDRQYQFGFAGAVPFIGDWNGSGTDKIGIYYNGFWYLDKDGNGIFGGPAVDIATEFGWPGVTPFVADWNGDGKDSIGIYIDGFWFVDYNANAVWDGPVTDRSAEFGFPGVTPMTGDWDGDGTESVGIYINGFWYMDVNGNFAWDGPGTDSQANYGFTGVIPLIGDWSGDGADKIGIYYNGIFYLDVDGSLTYDGGVVDKGFVYGGPGDIPTIGVW